ncbi:MAG: hypothetical protein AAF226_03815 [Verrucomicrobiota bacterium]
MKKWTTLRKKSDKQEEEPAQVTIPQEKPVEEPLAEEEPPVEEELEEEEAIAEEPDAAPEVIEEAPEPESEPEPPVDEVPPAPAVVPEDIFESEPDQPEPVITPSAPQVVVNVSRPALPLFEPPVPNRDEPSEPELVPLEEALDESPEPKGPPRVLVVHHVPSTHRLVKESIENFTDAEVDATSDILHAFSMAVSRDYDLFIFGIELPAISGSLLYELIGQAYAHGQASYRQLPAIVFVREEGAAQLSEDLARDVRVKAVWSKPLEIERMIETLRGIANFQDPTESY